jgi:hypothetical protein
VAASGVAEEKSVAASKLLSAAGAFWQESVTEMKRDVATDRAAVAEDAKHGGARGDLAQDASQDVVVAEVARGSASTDEL